MLTKVKGVLMVIIFLKKMCYLMHIFSYNILKLSIIYIFINSQPSKTNTPKSYIFPMFFFFQFT